MAVLVISAIFGMFSEGFDRLWVAHILQNFTLPSLGRLEPIVWFGLIEAVAMFLTLGVAEIVRRQVDMDSHQAAVQALLGVNGLLIAGMVLVGLTTNFALALLAYWLASTLRATLSPLYLAWLNQHIESKVRATMFSVNGQVDAIGQIAGGPVVGAIGTIFSLRVALVVSGLILTPALPLYTRTLRYNPVTIEIDGKG